MDSDSADILGGQLNIAKPDSGGYLTFSRVTLFVLLLVSSLSIYVWIRIQPTYAKYRDQQYRKQKRRRYGIPDDDNRPFDIALAAVMARRKPIVIYDVDAPQPTGNGRVTPQPAAQEQNTNSSANGNALHPETQGNKRPLMRGNGGHTYMSLPPQTTLNPPIYPPEDYSDTNLRVRVLSSSVRAFVEAQNNRISELNDVFEGDQRLHTNEVVETQGDDIAEVHDDSVMALDDPSDVVDHDEPMDEDMDEIMELRAAPRGKKRARADAGSTFGGDDSGYENDPAEEPRRTRQRPRRTYKQQNSVPRGQKRNRDRSDDGEGDSSDTSPRKSNRRKREKSSSAESSAGSDSILGDPQTRGRRIGEEWEANGIRYKVGPNGERLREAVVTRPRPLFPMPEDSKHPDREKQVGVLVRDWFTEEEYQLAKERLELGHQFSRRQILATDVSVNGTPVKGKDLHYSTPISGPNGKSSRVKPSVDFHTVPGPTPSFKSRRISSISSLRLIPQSISNPSVGTGKNEQSSWEKTHQENVAMSRLTRKYQMLSQSNSTPAIITTPPSNNGTEPSTTQPTSSLTFGAPAAPTPSAATGEQSKASFVSFPPMNGTSQSETKVPAPTPAPTSGATLSFGMNPANSTPAPAPAPTPSAAPAPAPSTTTFAFPKPAVPASAPVAAAAPLNFFGQNPATPSVPTAAVPPAPAPSAGFSILGAASNNNASTLSAAPQTSQPEPPKPTFAFGAPSQPNTTPTPVQSEAPKPQVGFALPTGQNGATSFFGNQQQKPAEQPSVPSLLSRLGGFSTDAPKPTAPAPTTTNFAQTTLSFGAPVAMAPPTSAPSTSAPPAQPTTTPAPTNGPLKFNFGITKPAAPSSTIPASNEAPKAPPAMFGFGAQPAAPAAPTQSQSSFAAPTQSQSSFAPPAQPQSSFIPAPPAQSYSAFAPPAPTQPHSTFAPPAPAPQSAFAPSTPASQSAFTPPTPAPQSAFTPTSQSTPSAPIFSAFGSTATGTTEKKDDAKTTATTTPKFSFGFNPSINSSTSASTPAVGAFGAPKEPKEPKKAPAPARFTFGPGIGGVSPAEALAVFGNTAKSAFGAPSTSTSTFVPPSGSAPTFGVAAGSSPNIFGAPAAPTANGSFGFGAPATSTTQVPPTPAQKQGERKAIFTFDHLPGASSMQSPFGPPKAPSAFGVQPPVVAPKPPGFTFVPPSVSNSTVPFTFGAGPSQQK